MCTREQQSTWTRTCKYIFAGKAVRCVYTGEVECPKSAPETLRPTVFISSTAGPKAKNAAINSPVCSFIWMSCHDPGFFLQMSCRYLGNAANFSAYTIWCSASTARRAAYVSLFYQQENSSEELYSFLYRIKKTKLCHQKMQKLVPVHPLTT